MLAEMLAKHPSELYADFREYYHADFDALRGEIGEIRTADLVSQLPYDCRTFRAENPELEWTLRDWLLWSVDYSLRVLVWQNTEDGQKGRNKPRPLPTPADRARVSSKVDATDMSYIAEQLGIEIGGVDG